jgi:sulfatase modifying factor 1
MQAYPSHSDDCVAGMVIIAAGFFMMGSETGFDNEMPRHRVWLDSFGIGRVAVTHREFGIFIDDCGTKPPPFWSDAAFSHPDQPVVGVTWHEATAYCEWLQRRTGQDFRLPTEAEREHAARGPRQDCDYPWGNEPPWERPYSGHDPETAGPLRVGVNPANDFGLYDMSEGVHEWCSDFYDAEYYHYAPERNPQGPSSGARRVSRGGSWRHRIKFSRCAARSSLPPSFRYSDYGFRLALTP